jgi:hypothetical protein
MDRLGQSELVSLLQFTRDCYALGASESIEDFLGNLAQLPRPKAILR